MLKTERLRIFSGPNGSGKSTLYNEAKQYFSKISFVNADELELVLAKSGLIDLTQFDLNLTTSELQKFLKKKDAKSLIEKAESEGHSINIILKENCIVDQSKITHSYEASLIASFIRWALYNKKKGFAFESVMSHKSKLNEIISAKKKGLKIYLYFVCIDNPAINIERVKDRVKKGGHNVNSEKLKNRYLNTLKNLYPSIRLSDKVYLFDNSGKSLELIAEISNEKMTIKSNYLPNWFIKFVLPYYNKL